MDNIDNFKQFVKNNPSFANYIKDGSMTWQKFYELYDMYGEDSSVWDKYKGTTSINDLVNIIKKIDVNKFGDGINSLSKALNVFSDLFTNKNNNDNYTPRAIYRRFDD